MLDNLQFSSISTTKLFVKTILISTLCRFIVTHPIAIDQLPDIRGRSFQDSTGYLFNYPDDKTNRRQSLEDLLAGGGGSSNSDSDSDSDDDSDDSPSPPAGIAGSDDTDLLNSALLRGINNNQGAGAGGGGGGGGGSANSNSNSGGSESGSGGGGGGGSNSANSNSESDKSEESESPRRPPGPVGRVVANVRRFRERTNDFVQDRFLKRFIQ
uniref:Uncharacterized protein n=1 Tax=Tetranychus urticae TaxID=32264 RepID=T1KXS2_TETUR